jgi:DNA-binding transcriptional regulator YiaG
MTTATKTRPSKKTTGKKPKKTTKKTGKKPAGSSQSKAGAKKKKKKPKWTLVTFKQIEARRNELGLSKTKMATLIGVTNSTLHNWQRGTTVPHESQQTKILQAMHSGPSVVPAERPASARQGGGSKQSSSSATRTRAASKAGKGRTTATAQGNGATRQSPKVNGERLDESARVTDGGTTCSNPDHDQPSVPTRTDVENLSHRGAIVRLLVVDRITRSYIEQSKTKLSAGSVLEFVKGLRAALA